MHLIDQLYGLIGCIACYGRSKELVLKAVISVHIDQHTFDWQHVLYIILSGHTRILFKYNLVSIIIELCKVMIMHGRIKIH